MRGSSGKDSGLDGAEAGGAEGFDAARRTPSLSRALSTNGSGSIAAGGKELMQRAATARPRSPTLSTVEMHCIALAGPLEPNHVQEARPLFCNDTGPRRFLTTLPWFTPLSPVTEGPARRVPP